MLHRKSSPVQIQQKAMLEKDESLALKYNRTIMKYDGNAYFYHQIVRIRKFEEAILENFPKGIFWGTTHTYLGQEANAVGILSNLQPGDIVFSNHRSHGHFLAYGGDMFSLFAELMGKPDGVCHGRGGSQHLHWRDFYSNGIQGGIVPVASGMALAEKYKGSGALAVVFLGDGTLGEGTVYESLNMASLWGIPILFVVENNHIAQTTPADLTIAGSIISRFQAFAISTVEMDTSDVLEIHGQAEQLLEEIRRSQIPQALVLNTFRFGPHSKGDDTRDAATLAKIKADRDPVTIQGRRLSEKEKAACEEDAVREVTDAFRRALDAPIYPEAAGGAGA